MTDVVEHFGVKGMHWGVRKAKPESPRASGYSDEAYVQDKRKFGDRGVRRINERMHNGTDYASARKAEVKRRRNQKLLFAGGYLAARMLLVYGPTLAQAGAQAYVGSKHAAAGAKAAANLFSDARGIGAHKIVDLGFNAATNVWS